MLTKRIIPCLDVDAGRVVKGVKYVEHVDAGDPVEQARIYDQAGADELCLPTGMMAMMPAFEGNVPPTFARRYPNASFTR